MKPRTLGALLVYCLLFSISFVILYPIYYDSEQRLVPETAAGRDEGIGRRGKPAHVANAVEQRQVLGLYEDSQSFSSERGNSLVEEEPRYVAYSSTN